MSSGWATRAWAVIAMGLGVWCGAAELAYKAAPIDNPLKGIIPSAYGQASRRFPHSLGYVDIALAEVMFGPERFEWSVFDRRLEAISKDGRQAVARVYLDWPGRTNTIPVFLNDATSIVSASGWRDGERIPDYESPTLQAALKNFVAAFGAKYDGSPDIAFVEAGLLGAWGEWFGTGRAGPTGSVELQKEILAAYEKAFRQTKILARFPTAFSVGREFGYHDDWFGHKNSMMNDRFAALGITNVVSWQRAPMGGRVHPEIQKCLSKATTPCVLSDAHMEEVRAGHFSYLRIGDQNALRPGTAGWEHALKLSQAMGYEFYMSQADVDYDAGRAAVKIEVTMKNTGVAPFYYAWPVELGLVKEASLKQKWNVDWDIRRVMPGENGIQFRWEEKGVSVSPGKYRAAIRIRNPAARGRPISFANETQDADLEGWLSLGSVTIEP